MTPYDDADTDAKEDDRDSSSTGVHTPNPKSTGSKSGVTAGNLADGRKTLKNVPMTCRSPSLSQYKPEPLLRSKPVADLSTVGELRIHEKTKANTAVSAVYRTAHVKFNASTNTYEGLPEEWQAHLKKKFGLPLQLCATLQVPGYSSRLPPILVQMKKYLLENGGLDMKGIFRLAPEESEASKVKQQLNDGTFESCDDVNVIANLLKVWFRDMPARLLDQIRESNQCILDCTGPEQAGEIIMTRFRDPHLTLLLWLLDLCCDISSNSDVNMMTPQNMAIVFTPNLFKLPEGEINPVKSMSVCKKYTVFFEYAIKWRLTHAGRIEMDQA